MRFKTKRRIHGILSDGNTVVLAEAIDDVLVFHAATAREEDRLVTSGGRVLGVTGLGDSLDAALSNAYGAIGKISFEGMHYRSDIGRRGEDKQ